MRRKGGRSDEGHRGLHDYCEKLYADNSADCEDSVWPVGACATRCCGFAGSVSGRQKRKWKNIPNRILIIGLYFRIYFEELELEETENQSDWHLEVDVFHVNRMKSVRVA